MGEKKIVIHRIYTGNENQAAALAGLFEDEGCAVRFTRPIDQDFVLLEVGRAETFLRAHFDGPP